MLLVTLAVVLCQASEYPKVVRRDGQVCVQQLNDKGAVEESCRAEGSDVRSPLPSAGSTPLDARPVPSPSLSKGPTAPPTPGALYWAGAKQNWALAFKIGAVAAISSTLISSIGALIAGSSGVPHAGDTYLGAAAISGAGALLFTVVAVLFDRWGFHEIEPEADGE